MNEEVQDWGIYPRTAEPRCHCAACDAWIWEEVEPWDGRMSTARKA